MADNKLYTNADAAKLKELLEAAIDQLRVMVGCKACIHFDKSNYPCSMYCDMGGCCGGDAAHEEDMFEWCGPLKDIK